MPTRLLLREVFELTQEIRRGKTSSGFPKNQFSNPDYEPYELTGLLTCSECGLQIRVARYDRELKNGEKIEVRSLRCKKGCNYIAYETVLSYVEQLLHKFKSIQASELQQYLAQAKVVNEIKEKESIKTKQMSEQNFEQRIKALQEELVSSARYIGTIGENVFLQLKNRIEAEIKAIEEIKKSHEEASPTSTNEKQRTTAVIKLAKLYDNCQTRTQKHKILSSIFYNIELKVLQRGIKGHPAKCQLTPYFKYHIEEKNF